MDKRQFLDSLDRELNILPRSERETYLSYYDELIEDRKETGLTETEAVCQAGSVRQIASDILGDRMEIKVKMPSTGNKVLNIVLLTLGFPLWGSLGLVVLILIAVAYLLIWLIPLILGGTAVTCVAVAVWVLAVIPTAFFVNGAGAVFMLGAAVALIGLGGLIILATVTIAKYFVKGSAALTRLIVRPFRRKEVRL